MEETVEGEHRKRATLDQPGTNNRVRVLATPYLNIPQLVNVEILKVHLLIRMTFSTPRYTMSL